MEKGLKEFFFKYALQNAVRYNGKAEISSVIGKILQEKPELKKEIKKIAKEIAEAVKEANNIPLIEQISELKRIAPELLHEEKHEKQETTLPELPDTKGMQGKITMRLAPFPSGALHIGNAKTYLLNAFYAEKYSAKLLLVMDDTIGSMEKQIMPEAYKLIEDAFQWLNVKYEKPVVYKSDRLEIYYKHAEKLIEKGKAYVCFCSAERLRKNREDAKECECRQHTARKNMEEWKNMLQGEYKGGQAVLRIKTSMQDKNPAFRDRVLFRISNREHPRTNRKYSVWPLLEFSWAIDDHLLGITHIIRGKDLMIESEMCKFVWNIFGWNAPVMVHAGLVRIEGLEGVKISKSKAQEEVRKGVFTGWDDPRTWSIQSLKRRGIKAESIREFIKSIGLNESDIIVPVDILYAINRKKIETCNRHFFVAEPSKIKISAAPDTHAEVPLHPDHPERGARKFQTKQEFYVSKIDFEQMKNNKQVYRFMHLFNFLAENFSYHSTKMQPELNAKLIHWLPADKEHEKKLVKTEILMPDGSTQKGLAEEGIKNLKEDDIIQFERFGFCRLDSIDEKNRKAVFWFSHK